MNAPWLRPEDLEVDTKVGANAIFMSIFNKDIRYAFATWY